MGNFKVWIENITLNNLLSTEAFENDSQRLNGFKAGEAASAVRVNTALRQSTLITAALMESLGLEDSTDIQSGLDEVKTAMLAKHPFNLQLKQSGQNLMFGSNLTSGQINTKNILLGDYNTCYASSCFLFGDGIDIPTMPSNVRKYISAFGKSLRTSNNVTACQTIVGQFNEENDTAKFIVGVGSDNDNRKNALTVDDTGVYVSSLSISGSKVNLQSYTILVENASSTVDSHSVSVSFSSHCIDNYQTNDIEDIINLQPAQYLPCSGIVASTTSTGTTGIVISIENAIQSGNIVVNFADFLDATIKQCSIPSSNVIVSYKPLI